jgi:hypothetical protein
VRAVIAAHGPDTKLTDLLVTLADCQRPVPLHRQ